MLLGAHCSGGVKGALDRAVEIGADAVQLFTQSPRTWKPPAPNPEAYEAFRERRRETGIGAVLCHALYLCNLAAPDDTVYEKSVTTLSATVDIACAIEAEGVVFHVGSHLGAGLEAGIERVEAAMRSILDRCSDTTWLLMENSAGAGGTIGRSIDELAHPLRPARRPPAPRHLPRLVPPVRVRLRRDRPAPRSTRSSTSSTRRSASTACGPCTSTTPRRRSARTATGTTTSSTG